MNKKQHITAFYLETLLMIVVFISIILVLTRVFGRARVQSVQAKTLTAAVTLAQNTAEAVSASGSPGELARILDEGGNVFLTEGKEGGQALVTAAYDAGMTPVPLTAEETAALQDVSLPPEGTDLSQNLSLPPGVQGGLQGQGLLVQTVWNPSGEGMAAAVITVYNRSTSAAVYSLQTADYLR